MHKRMQWSVGKEVQEALEQNKPIVALESTIISHGMPFPQVRILIHLHFK